MTNQAAQTMHPDALRDGTLSKSTAKRLAAASVSERARELLAEAFSAIDPRRGDILSGRIGDPNIRRALRAIEQALTQQRGEVDWLAFADELEAFRPRGELGALHGAGMAFAYKDVAKTIRAKLTATPQPSADAVREVPEGMVLVPREPTEEMVAAWRSSVPDDSCMYHANDETWSAWCSESWNAMLSAASGEKGVG